MYPRVHAMRVHVGHSTGGRPRLLANTTQESNTRSENHVLKHHNKRFATSQKAGYNTRAQIWLFSPF